MAHSSVPDLASEWHSVKLSTLPSPTPAAPYSVGEREGRQWHSGPTGGDRWQVRYVPNALHGLASLILLATPICGGCFTSQQPDVQRWTLNLRGAHPPCLRSCSLLVLGLNPDTWSHEPFPLSSSEPGGRWKGQGVEKEALFLLFGAQFYLLTFLSWMANSSKCLCITSVCCFLLTSPDLWSASEFR